MWLQPHCPPPLSLSLSLSLSQLVISNQNTRYSMSWCAGWLTIVLRSPPARSLSWIQSFVDWFMAPRKWGFNLKTKSTNCPDHGHHVDPPPTRKIPMVEPGIEPGTSWLVVRSSDHQTTRLVALPKCLLIPRIIISSWFRWLGSSHTGCFNQGPTG
jgi:hypothetical protein